jgi:hypothetical protein
VQSSMLGCFNGNKMQKRLSLHMNMRNGSKASSISMKDSMVESKVITTELDQRAPTCGR